MKDRIEHDANAGDPYACLGMAYFYHTGKEYEQDLRMAVNMYERAAEGGCPRAHWELAKLYRDGEVVVRDLGHYIDHLTHAAEMGNAEAQFALGQEYYHGTILSNDDNKAFEWFRRAADNGVARAKFMVGYFYGHGISVPKSKAEAELWYASTGLTGDAELFLEIGLNYEFGMNGLNHNEVEAGRWYKFGADMGHEKSILCWRSVLAGLNGESKDSYDVRMYRLSSTATHKEAVARDTALETANEFFDAGDEAMAFTYYERAAGLGSPLAMFNIAMMYRLGIYVKRNDKKSLEILARAASAGSEDAQFFMGKMYDGDMLPKDENEAIKYYTQAAANGFLAAFYYLGRYVEHPEVYVRRSNMRR